MNKFKDPKGMIDAVYSFADYIEGASEIGKKISLRQKYNNIYNIVIAGMGGSAIGGDINNMLLRDDLAIPLIVSRNYNIPKWANKHTLVIVSSYSGDTEETLSAFDDALLKECQIIGITTGGTLLKKINGIILIILLCQRVCSHEQLWLIHLFPCYIYFWNLD